MRKILSAIMTIGLLAVGATGCRKAGDDIAGSVCQKAGGCDSLSGITADQCRNAVNNSLQRPAPDAPTPRARSTAAWP